MLIVLKLLIDAAILGFLLLVVGRIDVTADFMKPLAVIMLTAVAGMLVALVFDRLLWGLVPVAVSVTVLYLSIGWFYDLQKKRKVIIVGLFLGIQIVWSVLR